MAAFDKATRDLEDAMQLIKAIVRPDKVDDVKDALTKIHVAGMTVSEVRGHGKQKGHTAIYRGKEYQVTLLPKMQIETVVADEVVEAVVEAIIGAARTGEIGDGRVFVTPVSRSYKIRTGESE
jgi:nitrogen regulatory protein PII